MNINEQNEEQKNGEEDIQREFWVWDTQIRPKMHDLVHKYPK